MGSLQPGESVYQINDHHHHQVGIHVPTNVYQTAPGKISNEDYTNDAISMKEAIDHHYPLL